MDLDTVTEVVRRPADRPGADWREGDAWLAGGTWLYSAEQPDLRRLVDLTALHRDPLIPGDAGLEIAATLLAGNLLPSFLMSFVTMPYYVNRLLKRRLRPAPDEPATRTDVIGLGIIAVVTAFWAAVFHVVTTQIWTLP
jgi:hypothetical protein